MIDKEDNNNNNSSNIIAVVGTTSSVNSSPAASIVAVGSGNDEDGVPAASSIWTAKSSLLRGRWKVHLPRQQSNRKQSTCWEFFRQFDKSHESEVGDEMAACLLCYEAEVALALKESRDVYSKFCRALCRL